LSAWILPNDNKQTIGSNAIFSLLAFHSSIIVSKMFTERRGAGGGGGGGVGSSSIYKIYNNPIKLQEEFLF
jgi:hypothetical protein